MIGLLKNKAVKIKFYHLMIYFKFLNKSKKYSTKLRYNFNFNAKTPYFKTSEAE